MQGMSLQVVFGTEQTHTNGTGTLIARTETSSLTFEIHLRLGVKVYDVGFVQ